jgi:hypothetical protein
MVYVPGPDMPEPLVLLMFVNLESMVCYECKSSLS